MKVVVPFDIDFELLQQQHAWLLRQSCEEADGLIGIVNAIQDNAVDVAGLDESTVFGGTLADNE